ncbi:MAG: hypothetical protein JSS66_06365 [Armatimonadetes bacterium]|nr:hypothetical protein [Armatimonadota bacterium]
MKQELIALRTTMERAASVDTAYDGVYNPGRGALHGHCGAVAHVVQLKYGGELVGATVMGERHIWNRLPDGKEYDLTSAQFGGDGLTPVCRGRLLKKRSSTNDRFVRFATLVGV